MEKINILKLQKVANLKNWAIFEGTSYNEVLYYNHSALETDCYIARYGEN